MSQLPFSDRQQREYWWRILGGGGVRIKLKSEGNFMVMSYDSSAATNQNLDVLVLFKSKVVEKLITHKVTMMLIQDQG